MQYLEFIKKHNDAYKKYFYMCGSPPMKDAIEIQLSNLQVVGKLIIKEVFKNLFDN